LVAAVKGARVEHLDIVFKIAIPYSNAKRLIIY